ncbi:MAG: RNA polymerase sigma factor [Planctomycetota bacterium]|jgi:RNA polymerase sigma-70 factor (ECF subfamily)
MGHQIDYVRLVRQAQRGDKSGFEHLSKAVEQRLRVNVYRATLDANLTHDIVQETMLEMLKVLNELREADRFWPWLYKIAINKIRLHHRKKADRKAVPLSTAPDADRCDDRQDAMADMISRELKETVANAMRQLKAEHRTVLTLRCYDEMSYLQIAESMGSTEFAAQRLFARAKRALKRQLARQGFGKGSLLMALVVFGKMTAPTEAAAAEVSVTSAATKIGLAAALTGALASKTTVVTVAAAGVLGVGVLVATSGPEAAVPDGEAKPLLNSQIGSEAAPAKGTIDEYWYYFAEKADGPVMMRMMKSDAKGAWSYCAWRQNDSANYYFSDGAVHIRNARMWNRNLSVWRLPTDTPQLSQFLDRLEGRSEGIGYTALRGRGLLVMARSDGNGNGNHLRVIRHHHILDGEQFRYDWPGGVHTIDDRDAMHKRGWTYFRIKGRIDGDTVSGTGRMPFVYAAGADHRPWLRLRVGNRVEIVDSVEESLLYKDGGSVAASYGGGTFFEGLGRPWMGLHAVDTIRRDAAEQEIRFETRLIEGGTRAEVELTCEQGRLVYTIDMEKDVVEKIAISTSQGAAGELTFSYLQDIDEAGGEFARPRITRRYGSLRKKSPGILWLLQILSNQ